MVANTAGETKAALCEPHTKNAFPPSPLPQNQAQPLHWQIDVGGQHKAHTHASTHTTGRNNHTEHTLVSHKRRVRVTVVGLYAA